ncbi:MAG TPA: CPBP family intramembrane glutamic endopeptidase [Ignavibacteriaceae bacterium]|nr:CPBP family intramembrane glutamic endopeptidase [Ignavibacteriaceae bacterium]
MDDLNTNPIQNNIPDNNNPEEGNQGGNLPGKNIQPRISPITAAFIGLFGGFFLYQIVGGLLTLAVFGFDLKSAPVQSVRLMTMAGQILFILLPALIFAKWFYEDVTEIIRFRLPRWEEILLFTLGIVILTPLLQYYLSIQNYFINQWAISSPLIHSLKSSLDKLNDMVDKTYGSLLTVHTVFGGLLVIIVVAIVPAICEEVMFRGYIQRSFEFRLKPFWAALITAVFFGIYHFNPYGLLPLIGLGFYFGYAAYMSNSIAVPMSLHFFNNFTAVIFYFIFGQDDSLSSSVDKNFDLNSSLLILVALIFLFGVVMYLINKYYAKVKNA